MIILPNKPPDWSLEDRDELRLFLTSRVGRHLMDHLAWNCPRYVNPEVRVLESGIREGYEDCIAEIFDLAQDVPKPQTATSETYPDIEDNTAWVGIDKNDK